MYDRSSPEIDTPIPDIEAAGEEYLLDLAFDDRLDRLLERADHDMLRFDLDCETLLEIDKDFVPFTHAQESDGIEQPTCKVRINGYRYRGLDGEHMRVRFIPESLYADAATLEKQDDTFVMTKGIKRTEFAPHEAAGIILRATGTDSKSLDDLVQKHLIDPSMYGVIAERALVLAAEQSGQKSTESTVEIIARESTADKPVKIRLGRVETESPMESTVKMVVEKVWLHTELEAEEAYRIVLFFSNVHAEPAPPAGLVAQKSVRGDGFTLQSADFLHKDAHGRTTLLNHRDHDIVKLFVNAYDELVDSLPASDQ